MSFRDEVEKDVTAWWDQLEANRTANLVKRQEITVEVTEQVIREQLPVPKDELIVSGQVVADETE